MSGGRYTKLTTRGDPKNVIALSAF